MTLTPSITLSKIGNAKVPVLITHGSNDRYIPQRFSERLYQAANQPKRLLLIDGGNHNNSLRTGSGEYRDAIRAPFTPKVVGQKPA